MKARFTILAIFCIMLIGCAEEQPIIEYPQPSYGEMYQPVAPPEVIEPVAQIEKREQPLQEANTPQVKEIPIEPEMITEYTEVVEIRDHQFRPFRVYIAPGKLVEWVPKDPWQHQIVIEGKGIESEVFRGFDRFLHRFTKPGKYYYHDGKYPSVAGEVWVDKSYEWREDLYDKRQYFEEDIKIKNFEYYPKNVNIKKGTIVKWTNMDSTPHTVTGEEFNSERLHKEEEFEYLFNKPGIYDYKCLLHPRMKGRIIVES